MSLYLLIGYAALIAVSLFWWFVRLERTGRAATTVLLLLWLLVVESALYADPNEVPNGLFHPGVGADPDPEDEVIDSAISFRLFDLIIPIAVGARLYARGLPDRIRASSIWVFAFFAWLVGSAAIGFYNGNSPGLIAFELKTLVYLGVFGLAASVPFRDYTEGRGLYGLIYASSLFAAALIVTDGTNVGFGLDIPLVPLPRVGSLGADAASIFVALGLIALALGLFREHRRLRLLGAAGPLLLAPIVASQRAAILALLISFAVLTAAVVLTRRRLLATPTEIALIVLLCIGLATLPTVTRLALGDSGTRLPFAGEVQETFTSRAKQQSAQSRVNQWRKATELIEERPVTGWGLGKTYVHYDAGHFKFFETNYTHNMAGDLLLRMGGIGLALFAIAIVLSLFDAFGAWRRQQDDLAAALGIAAVAIIVGLLARGAVESLFEKYRLATMLGIILGMVGSVAVAPVRARYGRRSETEEERKWSSEISYAR